MGSTPARLRHKLEEVFFIEPNDLGNTQLTYVYKQLTSFLKTMPFLYVIPLSMGFSVFMYLLFGSLLVKLTTLLQYGF